MVCRTTRLGEGHVRFFIILRIPLFLAVPLHHNTFCLVYSAVLLLDQSHGNTWLQKQRCVPYYIKYWNYQYNRNGKFFQNMQVFD